MRPLVNILLAKKFDKVFPERKRVNPFPGKFPTRWFISIRDRNGPFEWVAITKPNVEVMKRVIKEAAKPDRNLWLGEFDKGGFFTSLRRSTPECEFLLDAWSQNVCLVYYPWSGVGRFFGPWSVPIYPKRILLGRRHYFTYAPWETLMTEAFYDHLRAHKSWLRKLEPWK